ncbi:MAG: hypothetical protein IIU44_05805 [Spirochaetales bacterium]|nr:hypothetical protein [Spirochaetales bacterium]
MRRLALSLISIMLCFVLAGCATNASAVMYEESADYSSAVVSYLGPEGTYTQEACGLFFGKQGTYMPYATVHDAVEALVRGDTDYAVIPQENTIGGAVIDYVDELIAQSSVCVVGEVELPINQNLLVLPGSDLGGIRKVYSHKQGITQGRAWMEQNIPQAEVIEVSSTAEGARMVAESKDPSCAAIASAACADVYGLEVLAAGIQNNESNRTRFYVLSKDEPASVTSGRLAFIAKGSASDLPALMTALGKAGASLVFIHDRPAKTVLGEYNYVIECSDLTYEEYLRLAGRTSFEIRYLGSFRCF